MLFRSLSRQITAAYLFFSIACCSVFLLIGVVIIEGIEVRLVDERLKEVADWAAPRFSGGLPVEMPTGLSFHHGEDIPASLRSLHEGVQEVTVDGVGLHVLGGRTDAGPFVVIDHESAYDTVEVAVYSMLVLCGLGFGGLSLLLGRFMARRFLDPIIDLSAAVAERRSRLPLLDANNELGILARAFDQYAKEMRSLLDREQFFTGDVSHELRTPLTVIRGAVEILAEQAGANPAMSGPIDRINRALRDATESVDILLTLARAPYLAETSSMSLASLAREQVALYQFLVQHKPVTLTFEGGELVCNAPPKLLAAALANLVRNACLYTEKGFVKVIISDHSLQVHDSGPGLPPAALAVLAGQARSPVGSEGSGLGLALVKRICDFLGIEVHVLASGVHGAILEIDCSSILHKNLTSP